MKRATTMILVFGALSALSAMGALTLSARGLDAGTLPPPPQESSYAPVNPAEAALGQKIFWDPILSGNRNISCGSCHHPRHGTSDGLSLGIGEGGIGIGPDRRPDAGNLPEQRIPRNAPALFNLGAREFTRMFHDGRIEADPARPSGLRTPLEDDMVMGFASILSAQTMFPVLSGDEMAGHYSENDVSTLVREGRITGPDGAWALIASRIAAIPAYAEAFAEVYPEIAAGRPIAFTDLSNAVAAFMAFEWRSDESAFDAYLRGTGGLDEAALRGMQLFYGPAGCADCHSGPFQTDHDFHAMGVPQIGPGKRERFENHARDLGRMRVTNRPEDAYAFRTPSLRNVLHTGPYGHDGAYRDLAAFIRAHADPAAALADYDIAQAVLPPIDGIAPDWQALEDPAETMAIAAAAAAAATGRRGVALDSAAIADLVAFLDSLTDEVALKGRLGIPQAVPSGLPVDR